SFAVVTPPAHGTLTALQTSGNAAATTTYSPAADYHGSDGFTFRAVDSHGAQSPVASVSLTVQSVNDAPTAVAQTVTVAPNTPKPIVLSGDDVDGDNLTFAIVTQPGHGSLSGTAPNLTYTPANGYSGADSFTFRVNDGQADSNTATVS